MSSNLQELEEQYGTSKWDRGKTWWEIQILQSALQRLEEEYGTSQWDPDNTWWEIQIL